jgi:hypothetical protein
MSKVTINNKTRLRQMETFARKLLMALESQTDKSCYNCSMRDARSICHGCHLNPHVDLIAEASNLLYPNKK